VYPTRVPIVDQRDNDCWDVVASPSLQLQPIHISVNAKNHPHLRNLIRRGTAVGPAVVLAIRNYGAGATTMISIGPKLSKNLLIGTPIHPTAARLGTHPGSRTDTRSRVFRRGFLIAVFVSAIAMPPVFARAARAAIWGYVARADVAAPGGKTQTWRLSGVVTATDINAAQAVARADALARLANKGNVLVGPTIAIGTPFVGTHETLESER
jgi:hypothetical protein